MHSLIQSIRCAVRCWIWILLRWNDMWCWACADAPGLLDASSSHTYILYIFIHLGALSCFLLTFAALYRFQQTPHKVSNSKFSLDKCFRSRDLEVLKGNKINTGKSIGSPGCCIYTHTFDGKLPCGRGIQKFVVIAKPSNSADARDVIKTAVISC